MAENIRNRSPREWWHKELWLLISLILLALLVARPAAPARAAAILVNSAADTVADDGVCTLREAIIAANTDTASGPTAGECAAGADPDTITFAGNYTITLGSQLPAVSSAITITGNGPANTIIQANAAPNTAAYRVFEVGGAGDLTLNGVTVRHGRCAGACATESVFGGGILNAGLLTVNNSAISSNVSTFFGGGIYNTGALTVTNSTFNGNTTSEDGGAIYNNTGPVTVTNSTFSANFANFGAGGAISDLGTLTVTNSTFAGNVAGFGGGGIYKGPDGAAVNMTNSLLSDNSVFNCVNVAGDSSNIASDASCGSATQKTVGQINLGPLADNGGPTPTHALLAGSHAIDFNSSGSCSAAPINGLDQRGFARNLNDPATGSDTINLCDTGAFEFQPAEGTLIVIKETHPEDPQDFNYNLYYYQPFFGLLDQFSLDDDGDDGNTLSNTYRTTLTPGKYGVSEAGTPGWEIDDIQCVSTNPDREFSAISFDPNNNGYGKTFDIAAGETITCTFINTPPPTTAELTIIKTTDPAGGTGFPFTLDPGPYSFDFKWGSGGSDDGQFNFPYGMAVDAAGNVYVADSNSARIQKFDAGGNFLRMWGWGVDDGTNAFQICTSGCQAGIPGNGDGQFDTPTGVAVDAAGNVYVADTNNRRIQKFNGNGVFLSMWGSSGSGDGEFNVPSGVAVDTAGFVYVADTFNNRIQKFTSDGIFVDEWGSFGNGDGQFDTPTGVAVDAAGNVYVADSYNHRIQKFDRDGMFLIEWGTSGSAEGEFSFPSFLAVDAAGNVYVADTQRDRVQKFDGGGSFLVMWGWGVADGTAAFQSCTSGCLTGLQGSGDGQFDTPIGLAVGATGKVYVADYANYRIQVFSPDNTFTLDDGQSESFNLPPGDYLVSELVPRGWVLDSGSCTGDARAAASAIVNPVARLTLNAGDDVTCTFSNSKSATIIVIKDAVPDDPTLFGFRFFTFDPFAWNTFALDDDGDPGNAVSNRVEFDVAPGTYAVSEAVPAGWELTGMACESSLYPDREFIITTDVYSDPAIVMENVDSGEVITCTFTNETVAPPLDCTPVPGNLILNFCFEDGKPPWNFHTDGQGFYNTSPTNPFAGSAAARVVINAPGSNVQLFQTGLVLQPNTSYELSFAAYSSNGRDMSLWLHKHGAPYTSYGLANRVIDLGTDWAHYSLTFTTPGLAGMNDGRLRFWFAPFDAAGTTYHIDRVVLRPGGGGPTDPDPDPPDIPPQGHCNPPVPGNLIQNPGFEGNKANWNFFTDAAGTFTTVTGDPYECLRNARVAITTQGTNVQLFQTGFTLKPNTSYRMRLAGRSNGGEDVSLFLHRHSAPYSNYGLSGVLLNLTSSWQVFVVDFTTTDFGPATSDTRLRLWLAPFDKNGTVYQFDDVVLVEQPEVAALAAAKETGAETRATPVKSRGATLLRSGYFIDDDQPGRRAGGFVAGANVACRAPQASPAELWPANGKMRLVNITNIGNPKNIEIVSVMQDEPVGPEPDAEIRNNKQVYLRAERDDGGDGRWYTITFEAEYGTGEFCTNTVYVTVPPANRVPAVDNGYQTNSLAPSP